MLFHRIINKHEQRRCGKYLPKVFFFFFFELSSMLANALARASLRAGRGGELDLYFKSHFNVS